jgi:hypothetical protein
MTNWGIAIMISATLLESIQSLTIDEKLSLIETIARVLRKELARNGSGKTQRDDSTTEPSLLDDSQQDAHAIIAELLSRPAPPREKMLRQGMFKGRVPVDEEIFRLAEWHPIEEDVEEETVVA